MIVLLNQYLAASKKGMSPQEWYDCLTDEQKITARAEIEYAVDVVGKSLKSIQEMIQSAIKHITDNWPSFWENLPGEVKAEIMAKQP